MDDKDYTMAKRFSSRKWIAFLLLILLTTFWRWMDWTETEGGRYALNMLWLVYATYVTGNVASSALAGKTLAIVPKEGS